MLITPLRVWSLLILRDRISSLDSVLCPSTFCIGTVIYSMRWSLVGHTYITASTSCRNVCVLSPSVTQNLWLGLSFAVVVIWHNIPCTFISVRDEVLSTLPPIALAMSGAMCCLRAMVDSCFHSVMFMLIILSRYWVIYYS